MRSNAQVAQAPKGVVRAPLGLVLGGAMAQALVGASAAVSGLINTQHLAAAQSLRYGLASALLAGVARLTGRSWPPLRRYSDWLRLAGVTVTGLVLFNVALVIGSRHAEPAVFGVAIAAVPLVLAVLGPMLAGHRPRALGGLAALVLTAGAVLIQSVGRCDGIGLACALVVFAGEAAFTLLAVPVLTRTGPWAVSVHTTWMAAACFGAMSLLGAADHGAGAYALTAKEWAAVGYLAVALTALAFVCWYAAVQAMGAATAGLLTGLAPVAAAITGLLLGGPVPSPAVWAGIAIVAAGITLGLAPAPPRMAS